MKDRDQNLEIIIKITLEIDQILRTQVLTTIQDINRIIINPKIETDLILGQIQTKGKILEITHILETDLTQMRGHTKQIETRSETVLGKIAKIETDLIHRTGNPVQIDQGIGQEK